MNCIKPVRLRTGMLVPCNKCIACLSRNRAQWSFRLENELRSSSSAHFITLTYEKNPVNVSKIDLQLFLKRLRGKLQRLIENASNPLKNEKIKYYITSEYGPTTFRPHYHGIFFNLPDINVLDVLIQEAWTHGFIKIGTVTPASIAYVTKYCITKQDSPKGCIKPFTLISKGLGLSYVDIHRESHLKSQRFYGTREGGDKVSLPRYYADRIFDDGMKADNNEKNNIERQEKIFELYERLYKQGENIANYITKRNEQIENLVKSRLTKKSKL